MAVLRYDFHSHPKIVGLPKATIGVYALALSYASGNLTDGFIPDSYARHIDPKRQHFKRLIEAGLAGQMAAKRQPNGGQTATDADAKRPAGYTLNNYLDHNPTKAQVEEKRRRQADHMRQIRAAKRPPRERSHLRPVDDHVSAIGKDNNLPNQESATSRTELQHPARVEGWDLPGDELDIYRKRSA